MHAIHWFEIPVTDLARAKSFYGTMLNIRDFRREVAGATEMAVFPYDNAARGVGGALIHGGPQKPASTGVVIYLNAGQDLRGAVDRAVQAGGRVVQPVTDIGAPGHVALVEDLEGNVVGLHQPPAPRES